MQMQKTIRTMYQFVTNDNLMNLEVTRLENVELKWSDLTITLDDDGENQSNHLFKSRPIINFRLYGY